MFFVGDVSGVQNIEFAAEELLTENPQLMKKDNGCRCLKSGITNVFDVFMVVKKINENLVYKQGR